MLRRRLIALAFAGVTAAAISANAAEIEVMTQNQYVGTDLIGLVTDPNFNAAVARALETRAASLPSQRARALAALIGQRNPALVAIEEGYRFTCVDPAPQPNAGCNDQAIAGAFTDQLADTLAALGGRYKVAATVNNLDIPNGIPQLAGLPGMPILYKGRQLFIGVLDRDVILARKDVATAVLPFKAFCARPSSTSDGCNYGFVASAPVKVFGQDVVIQFERGYVGVAATVQGESYKFVATHLETRLDENQGRVFQSGQAAELMLMVGPLATPGSKLFLAGDFNSDPGNEVINYPQWYIDYLLSKGMPAALVPYIGIPPYMQIAGSGFTDVWTLRPGKSRRPAGPGLSCCQDEDLANVESKYTERVDLLWTWTVPRNVPDVRTLGDSMADKTLPRPFGLWPSDHASVAARMIFGR
jgi:hypothetical protein